MALTATIHHFEIDLADHDRGVFESLAFTVARHPSESEDYLWTRVLAYLLEYSEGIEFSKGGLSQTEEPPVVIRDAMGGYRAWIDIGTPEADRLHKAAKSANRVAVYVHRDPAQWLIRLEGARIHRAAEIELYAMDRTLLGELTSRLERRMAFSVSVIDRELHVALESASLSGIITPLRLR
ncbi:MAG: YaeQ family protein [Acidobacteriaceae bacterium]|nr:YaeQ family protein [Acidobacteriaceae bacterium]